MTTPTDTTVTMQVSDLEALIRRVVHEVVHDEILLLIERAHLSPLNDWSQEGPDDPEGDQALLAEALTMRQEYRSGGTDWQDWQAFKSELQRSEAAGELPD